MSASVGRMLVGGRRAKRTVPVGDPWACVSVCRLILADVSRCIFTVVYVTADYNGRKERSITVVFAISSHNGNT